MNKKERFTVARELADYIGRHPCNTRSLEERVFGLTMLRDDELAAVTAEVEHLLGYREGWNKLFAKEKGKWPGNRK